MSFEHAIDNVWEAAPQMTLELQSMLLGAILNHLDFEGHLSLDELDRLWKRFVRNDKLDKSEAC
jgi:hypothetical protein